MCVQSGVPVTPRVMGRGGIATREQEYAVQGRLYRVRRMTTMARSPSTPVTRTYKYKKRIPAWVSSFCGADNIRSIDTHRLPRLRVAQQATEARSALSLKTPHCGVLTYDVRAKWGPRNAPRYGERRNRHTRTRVCRPRQTLSSTANDDDGTLAFNSCYPHLQIQKEDTRMGILFLWCG